MLADDIALERAKVSELSGVVLSDYRMHETVRRLALFAPGVIFLAVVVEKVMEQTCTRRAAGIETEPAADYVAVVRDVHAVLEAARVNMMSYILQPRELRAVDEVADAGVVAAQRKLTAG